MWTNVKEEYCYSLAEITKTADKTPLEYVNLPTISNIITSMNLNSQSLIKTTFSAPYWTQANEKGTLLWNKIFEKYYSQVAEITEDKIENNNFTDLFVDFINKFYTKWDMVHEKYDTLLSYYESYKDKLMDSIKSRGKYQTKFNDTPQNLTSSTNDFSNDSYVSNLTTNISQNESDGGTVIARLREIDNGFKNLWNDYVYEFRNLFISPSNFWEIEKEE